MAVPNTFATATSAIPLANLDANFAYYDGAFSISGTTTSFSGNVGIGTSSPVSKLQVTNSLAITATSGYQFLLIGNQDSAGTNKPTIIRSANASLQFGIGNSWSSSTGGIFTPYLNIGDTGNVGIGTSSPAGKLEVSGGRSWFTANSEFYSIAFRYSSSTGVMYMGATNSVSTPSIQFSNSGGTALATIDYSGNVGIGTSSPGAKLDVAGNIRLSSGSPVVQFNNGGPQIYVTTANTLQFSINSGSSEAMRINSSGQVGIGTSAPTGQLDVRTAAGVVAQSNLYTGSNAAVVKFNIGQVGAIDWDIGLNATAGNFYIGGLGGSMAEAYKIVRSGLSIDYQTWNTGGAERMRIDSSGNVGIGTNSPSAALNIARTSANAQILVSTTTSGNPSIYLDASGVNNGQLFVDRTDAGITKLQAGGVLVFQSNGANERMRIDSSGNVLVTNPAGLGYGTGSGGTVTQATSKSTAVTLNKPTGQITMNAAALAAGATAFFPVSNSLITASDTVIVSQNTTGVTNVANYSSRIYYVSAGAFGIALTNISGGSLSEACVLNFAIIKGATA